MKQIILQTLREQKLRALALVLLAVGAAGASLLPPQLLRLIVDHCLSAGATQGLPALAALYLAALVLIGLLDFGKGWTLTRLGQRVIRTTRARMMEKAARVPLGTFTAQATGVAAARFTTDAESINTLFADGVVSMAVDCLKIVGIIVSMALFSPGLALLALALAPALLLVSRLFQRGMLRAQTANLVQLGAVSGHLGESVASRDMIRRFHKEAYMEDGFCAHLRENYRTKARVNGFDACYAPVIQLLRAAAIAALVILSGGTTPLLGVTAGMLAASVELLSHLLAPIESLGMEFQSIQQGISGLRRVDAFLALAEEEKDEAVTAEQVLGADHRVRLVFDGVTFSYEPGQTVLRDISFTAAPQTSVVLAGRTGVGKTTLMNLMLGLLTPDRGTVTLNGVPAASIPDREKRRIFGYVEQKFQFIPGDVYRQITLGDGTVTEAQVVEACQFVGLHDTIVALPEGYRTRVADGGGFSQGQRQLLSIARAIVTRPPVLLLDEITASLDSATEARVVEVLDRACADRTMVGISHRAAAMARCDKLIFLENGAIQAEGPPEQVLPQM